LKKGVQTLRLLQDERLLLKAEEGKEEQRRAERRRMMERGVGQKTRPSLCGMKL
jgi:hypothetical protein